MKSQKIFDAMAAAVSSNGAALVKLGGAVFQFVISDAGPEGKFTLDLKNGSGSAKAGEDEKADVTISMKDDDMMAMFDGRLSGMQAFLSGRLKIKGSRQPKDARAILEAEATEEMSGIGMLDKAVMGICDGPGIFTIIWARRSLYMEHAVVGALSIFVQVFVPCRLIMDSSVGDSSRCTGIGVRLVACALALYLCSTFASTLDRITGKAILAYYVEGWRSAMVLGSLTLYASIALTTACTFVLFAQAPDEASLLMNAVALNFIVEVDVALVGLLKVSGLGHLDVSQNRLRGLSSVWTETGARQQVKSYCELSWMGRLGTSPALTLIVSFNKLYVAGMLVSTFLVAYFI
uniref:SCP2 domain-containing protein n=1 Tax=Alexandrium monilatum TaxID=311494 RepID=A0A7S4T158_9DINO